MKQSFYFYANPYQPRSVEAARTLEAVLLSRGAEIYTEDWMAEQGIGIGVSLSALPEGVRAVVAFGGDGTLLRAAPEAARQQVPVLGVHTGTIGFLMAGDAGRPEATAELLMGQSYRLTHHPMLEILYDGKRYLGLNDLSVTRGEHPGIMEALVCADGEKVFCAHGDGVVVSTPLGATAYSLSAGGPVVRPDTRCLIVTPVCAREISLRPVVLPLESRIAVTIHGRDRRRLQLAIDGQTLLPVTEEARVEVSLAREEAAFIRPSGDHFFSTLREKQALWNQQEEQE